MTIQQIKSLLLAVVVSTSLVAKKDKDSVLDDINQRTAYIARTVTQIEEMQKCSTVIMQKDVGSSGYVISSPGQYCLGEDIVFAPENPAKFTPITITDATGSGAEGLAAVSGGVLRGIFVVSGGSGYTAPTISIGGSGSGAAATATLSGGSIVNFNVTSGGSGYRDTVQAAITITCGNVNLQMKNCTLSQAGAVDASSIPAYSGVNNPSSQVPFVVGILVPDNIPTNPDVNAVGTSSVYISGDQAIIDGFSMWGVYCQGHVADVQLSNMTIKNCGLLASYYLRPFAGYFPNGDPLGYYATPGTLPFAVGGMNFGESDVLGMGPYFFMQNSGVAQNRISSLMLNGVSSLNNFSFSSSMSNVTDMYIGGSHFDGTLSDDPNVWAYGLSFGYASGALGGTESDAVLNAVVEQSTCNNTSMLGDATTAASESPAGIFAGFINNVYFSYCNFDHTQSTFAANLAGASLNSTLSSCVYDHCSFSDVNGIGEAIGFFSQAEDFFGDPFFSNDVQLTNCQISNIQQNGQNQLPAPVNAVEPAAGLFGRRINNFVIADTVVSDIISNGPSQDSIKGIDFGRGVNTVFSNLSVQRVIANQGGLPIGYSVYSGDASTTKLLGVSLDNCIAEGIFAMTPIATYTSAPYLNSRGAAAGFSLFQNGTTIPVSVTNCKAMHVRGLPIDAFGNYSVGFLSNGASGNPVKKHSYYNCQAIDNVYGFMLFDAAGCVVRNCQSDLNVADDGVTGAGFTDLGSGTPAAPTQSFSLFQSNKAFENGAGSTHFGPNGNYNVKYGAAATDYVPTLTGNLTHPNAFGGSYFPEANYIAHNLSITQS